MIRWSLGFVVLAALPLGACWQKKVQVPEIVRPVLTTVVTPTTEKILGFAGTIEPEFSANLAFRLLGRMVARDVDVGDRVTRGETLAALDPTALDLGVRVAKAELSNAEAQFANASASEERQRVLLESRNVSQAVYDEARQAMQAAMANVERARATLAKAEERLGYARLFSDFDGVVTAVGAMVGQTVSSGQTIVTVARADARDAVLDVPDQLVGDLAIGTAFEVELQSLPSIRVTANLREIAPQADSATRTRRVRLTLVDPPVALRLGSTITATRFMAVAPTIQLPLSALLEVDGRATVWIVNPQTSTVVARHVEVLKKGPDGFTVGSGLEAGMHVVVAGVHSLKEGQKTRILAGDGQ